MHATLTIKSAEIEFQPDLPCAEKVTLFQNDAGNECVFKNQFIVNGDHDGMGKFVGDNLQELFNTALEQALETSRKKVEVQIGCEITATASA